MSLNEEIALRCCVPGDEEALALVGAATFLETFAGLLTGPDILAHCRVQHAAANMRHGWPILNTRFAWRSWMARRLASWCYRRRTCRLR